MAKSATTPRQPVNVGAPEPLAMTAEAAVPVETHASSLAAFRTSYRPAPDASWPKPRALTPNVVLAILGAGGPILWLVPRGEWEWWKIVFVVAGAVAVPAVVWWLDLPLRYVRAAYRRLRHYEEARASAAEAILTMEGSEAEFDAVRGLMAIAIPLLKASTIEVRGITYAGGRSRLVLSRRRGRTALEVGDELYVYDHVYHAVRGVVTVCGVSPDSYEAEVSESMDGLWWGVLNQRAINRDSNPPDNTVAIVRNA